MSLRLDRLATLYVARPLRSKSKSAKASVPILMYHSIADEDESSVHAYYRTATHPRVFAEQMQTLHDEGYAVLSLGAAVARLQEDASGAKSAVITFDDGYRNFYSDAFPILQRFGFSATMYLPTAFIGEQAVKFKGKDCMTWSQVRELEKYAISFGSHTVTHPKLHGMTAAAIREEIFGSKQTLEEKLGHAVESFAYPYAFPETDIPFKTRLRELLVEAGYRNGVCTTLGCASAGDDPFFLKRLPVNSCDDGSLFTAKLAGAYDWLAAPQRWAKLAKAGVTEVLRP